MDKQLPGALQNIYHQEERTREHEKIVLVVAAVVLCMAFAVGCAAPAAAPSESASAAAPSESAPAAEASEETPAAANTDYMSWTATEWDAASDAEKTAASEALLMDVGDVLMDGFSDLMQQAETNESVRKQLEGQVETLKTQIGNFLASSPEVTIGDLAEASKQVAGSAK